MDPFPIILRVGECFNDSLNSRDLWRASCTLNRAGIFFKCANTFYPVKDVFGASDYCSCLLDGFFCLRTYMVPWEAPVLTQSGPDNEVFTLAPVTRPHLLSCIMLMGVTSPFSSSSLTAPRLASFWSSGIGFQGYDQSFLSHWGQHSLRTPDYAGKSSILLRNCSFIAVHGSYFMERAIPIISNSSKDSGNCFRRRTSYFVVATHSRLNHRRCCKGPVCPL